MGDRPIGDYALLSDSQGAALVSRDGSIDWWCAPRFDSRSAFARLLDDEAGHWSLRPAGPFRARRRYRPGTMVLETEFTTDGGRVRLTDALALEAGARGHAIGHRSPHALVRAAECLDGEVDLVMEMAPRPEYGLVIPHVERRGDAVVTLGGADRLELRASRPVECGDDRVRLATRLRGGDVLGLSLRHLAGGHGGLPVLDPVTAVEDAAAAWRSWEGQHARYEGYAAEAVRRSALVLQALTYAPSGAIVAAPTTSLPETPGGAANWDYRYAWLRDASLTLRALWIAACPDEAERHFDWMARAAAGSEQRGGVQIVFGVDGERDLGERELDHLRGWRGNSPVRVGNDAWRQKQLDVLGEVLDSAHQLREQVADGMSPHTRHFLGAVADMAARRWEEPDSGIWEGREGERHYLSSKVMCWVALDRAIDMADLLGADAGRRAAWARERDRIRAAVMEHGWSDAAGAFGGAFGSHHLDASVLMMPLVGFIPADDERMLATIAAIERDLGTGDGLIRRWTGADDGAFAICSYWLADCLARAGRLERAREVFEAVTACANDVGLLAEEIDLCDRTLLGNFPQGLSHVGLITAAWSIERARREAPGAASRGMSTASSG